MMQFLFFFFLNDVFVIYGAFAASLKRTLEEPQFLTVSFSFSQDWKFD